MKKTFYQSLCAFFLFVMGVTGTNAQSFSTHSETLDSLSCGNVHFFLTTAGCTTGLTAHAAFGDGATGIYSVTCSGSTGYLSTFHNYATAGTYTVRFELFSGTTPLDTLEYSYVQPYCTQLPLMTYVDMNSNCIYDAGDIIPYTNAEYEVDSASTPIDTIIFPGGCYYACYGAPGTTYQFKVLTAPGGLTVTCPSTGIISYVVPAAGYSVTPQYFGMACIPTTPDLVLSATSRAALTGARASGWVFNTSCSPVATTVKIDMSPKYTLSSVWPSTLTYTVTGSSVTIDVGAVTALTPKGYEVHYTPVGTLTLGDTANTTQTAYPLTGDPTPANNVVTRVDTIKASLDPNIKSVLPTGDIAAGTTLQYMLEFENTGNDTAHNIHIMDTLSNYLDVSTLKVLNSSHGVQTLKYTAGGSNIVKFDFANIMLPDSSHHGVDKGMVVFSIQAKTTLPFGTVIPNRGGIYFDTNPVVMTNTAYSKIPVPPIGGVSAISNRQIVLYPNPVKNTLSFVVDPGSYTSLTISNVLGQQVIAQDFSPNVNVSSLPSGIYYITLKGSNNVTTMKFEKL